MQVFKGEGRKWKTFDLLVENSGASLQSEHMEGILVKSV
jgi:hypothetical protein